MAIQMTIFLDYVILVYLLSNRQILIDFLGTYEIMYSHKFCTVFITRFSISCIRVHVFIYLHYIQNILLHSIVCQVVLYFNFNDSLSVADGISFVPLQCYVYSFYFVMFVPFPPVLPASIHALSIYL